MGTAHERCQGDGNEISHKQRLEEYKDEDGVIRLKIKQPKIN